MGFFFFYFVLFLKIAGLLRFNNLGLLFSSCTLATLPLPPSLQTLFSLLIQFFGCICSRN